MILKGNQRGGGRQMALHLLNGLDNEHVTVHEVSGFIADDVLGALNEAHALSKATKCKQFMYSLSLNPPQDKKVPVADFEAALEKVEKKLALEGQPRVIVFHEKEGRRHAHCVWSRIDAGEMKAINMSFDRDKLNGISKSLSLSMAGHCLTASAIKAVAIPSTIAAKNGNRLRVLAARPQTLNANYRKAGRRLIIARASKTPLASWAMS
jgi:hypothetical protein